MKSQYRKCPVIVNKDNVIIGDRLMRSKIFFLSWYLLVEQNGYFQFFSFQSYPPHTHTHATFTRLNFLKAYEVFCAIAPWLIIIVSLFSTIIRLGKAWVLGKVMVGILAREWILARENLQMRKVLCICLLANHFLHMPLSFHDSLCMN